jgi:ubiquinone/menaquinone biosynthesis C-methylase UbiE
MSSAPTINRYANDWNGYSAEWERRYGHRYSHLGDEWCDDGTAERVWERRVFAHAVEPYLGPTSRVLEIGCGGGKWTVRLASRAAHLTVFDVAEAMLTRTRVRVEREGLANVAFVLGNGRDMRPVPDDGLDVVFSYDVFVHIALEDTVAYLGEIARVLRDGGVAILHHAVNDTRPAWDRIETHNDWYRDGHTLGQYYYHSRDALDRMYSRAGLQIESIWIDYCTAVIVARKPADSIVPRLERALRDAASADDDRALEAASHAIAAAGREVADRFALLAPQLRATPHGPQRYALIQQIRRLVRG